MNKYYSIFLCVLALCCWQCNDNDDAEPSGADRNWYVISPSDDPLDGLIYEVYREKYVPIFYNDTIGREKRIDKFGQEWTYYEILDPNYTIESVHANVNYVLSGDREKLKTGVEFLRDEVLGRLPEIVQPKCFLLVDSVFLYGGGEFDWQIDWRLGVMYRGAGCTLIGIDTLNHMSTSGRIDLVYDIISEEIGAYLKYHHSDSLNTFYKYSNATISTGAYGVVICDYMSDSPGYGDDWKYWYEYGFLSYDELSDFWINDDFWGSKYTTPSQAQDVRDFVVAIITMTDTEFEAEYGEYPVVMRKYELLKDLVRSLMNM